MISFSIKDSTLGESVLKNYYQRSAQIVSAIDRLNNMVANGKIDLVHLNAYRDATMEDFPLSYRVENTLCIRGKEQLNDCKFFSSHYIGHCCLNDVDITVTPRFGNKNVVFNHLLQYATNIFIPHTPSSLSYGRLEGPWLLMLLWLSALNKAKSLGQIPKEYIEVTENINSFKGRLDISKQIHFNLVNQARFYCRHQVLTFNNPINRTIRGTIEVLKSSYKTAEFKDAERYDSQLENLGVSKSGINIVDIDNIRYTRLNYLYKPVMNISKIILQHKQRQSHGENDNGLSYFIDMAELWEMYLLRVLQRNLPSQYNVYSPNSTHGDYLITGNMREIRPDIIIEKNRRIVMIIDAKYKRYSTFGFTSKDCHAVSRDDLYQMIAYLYHYGSNNENLIGLFCSPIENIKDNDVHSLKNNKKHKIGLLNLDIEGVENSDEAIRIREMEYCQKIISLIERRN
jgi:5-methylcytosine-specific restriction endonuclease McrBC regulatory subunit McrC